MKLFQLTRLVVLSLSRSSALRVGAASALVGVACAQTACGSASSGATDSSNPAPQAELDASSPAAVAPRLTVAKAPAAVSSAPIATDDYIAIPGARVHPSCVHEIPKGAVVDENDDVRLNGALVAHYDQCAYPLLRTRAKPRRDAAEIAPASVGPIAPEERAERVAQAAPGPEPLTGGLSGLPTLSGWIDYTSEWSPASATQWSLVTATMVVPPLPAVQSSQLLFFFPGLEPAVGDVIVQPVLQYGASPVGGGAYYGLDSWMVQSNNVYQAGTLDTDVRPGDTITTFMEMTGADATGYNWYTCATDTRTTASVCLQSHTTELMTSATPAVLEAYGVTACNQLPPEIEFSRIELITAANGLVESGTVPTTGIPTPNCGNTVRVATFGGATSLYINQTSAEVFGVGAYPYHLFHQSVGADTSVTAGHWNDWGTLGASGYLNGGPATVSWNAGRTDVFNFDSTYTLRHGYTDVNVAACANVNGPPCVDDWGAAPAGFQFTGEPTVASGGPGQLDIFANTTAGVLFQRTWNSGRDTGWVNRGNPGVAIASGPGAVTFNSGIVDVFVIGSDNNVYRGNWSSLAFTWTKWLGPQTDNGAVKWQGKPSVASWEPGRFDVMLIDTQGRLFDCGGDNGVPWGTCSIWTPPAGITFTNSPGVVALGTQRLLVAARGSDGGAWMKEWNFGLDTGNWVPTGGLLAGAQVGVSGF